MNTIVYYCNYTENDMPVCDCGTSSRSMAEFYAINLSRGHGRITVTAHYINGGIEKIGYAENGKFYANI